MTTPLPALQLPLVPPMQTTLPTPPHPSHHSAPYMTGGSGQQVYSSHHSQLPPPRTALWPWIAGGAIAVGLGIAGAVWYSSRGPQVTPVSPNPSVVTMKTEPILVPEPPPTPATIELRFDSLPSGGVYADGHSAELCRTPCSFNVDPADGGAKRTFVVRSAGYLDKPVDVDLGSTQHDFHVTLEHVAETPGGTAKPSAKPTPVATTPRKLVHSDASKPTKAGDSNEPGDEPDPQTPTIHSSAIDVDPSPARPRPAGRRARIRAGTRRRPRDALGEEALRAR